MCIGDLAGLGTVVAVWAHPDDETYLAGGLMAALADAGQRVVCVTASLGEHGTTDVERWPPARLAEIRRHEATAAMAVLGVREHHVLGLPDGALAAHDAEGVDAVAAVLDAVRPDTVVTFGADGMTFHADHVAVHRWVGEARSRCGHGRLLHATWTTRQLERFARSHEENGVYMDDRRPVGVPEGQLALHLRLDGSALDRKLVALRAMATQTAPLYESLGDERYAEHVSEECFVEG